MAEYLAPGVYVEETSYRPKSIEGVSTSTTAFVGPTRKGPMSGTPEVITSFGEFARIFGGLENLSFTSGTDGNPDVTNYMAHAVKSFFDNGGSRLYIVRTYTPRPGVAVPVDSGDSSGMDDDDDDDSGSGDTGDTGDTGTDTSGSVSTPTLSAGTAAASPVSATGGGQIRFAARSRGAGLNGTIIVGEKATPATQVTMNSSRQGSLLRLGSSSAYTYYTKNSSNAWVNSSDTSLAGSADLTTAALITVNIETIDADGNSIIYDNLSTGSVHPRFIGAVLSQNPSKKADAMQNPYYIEITGTVSAFALRDGLMSMGSDQNGVRVVAITGGNDGAVAVVTTSDADSISYEKALSAFENIEDISIVAAPGASSTAAHNSLRTHAEKMKYRIAVLDPPIAQSISDIRNVRSQIDSKYAALYYPWVVSANPLARPGNDQIPKEISLPPSGFITGIYARNDSQRGVWKAPANEPVRGAIRFEREINHAQQEVINPEGINCLRYFFGRGNRVWGARTMSSDPEWKYVNVRRYFIYLERSIDRSTQWIVFEPNNEKLWANVRETVSAFLFNEWKSGALLGTKPEEAFFVRCDRSTMTQNDLDNGRLICEIGVAVVYPAEFVIFRIGQKTADVRS